ncbi:phosphopantetheine-binding protein [Streptomyces sp. NPDC015171]|uniref:phosphopantetheine-binding protein n=1 Tax=Streptomyces sp. NPDC015171 TaxID=3364945 RepID=UPI0036F8FB45
MADETPLQEPAGHAADALETHLAQAWHTTFGVQPDGDSNFYDAGGESIDAARMASATAAALPDVEDLDVHLMTALLNEERLADVVRLGQEFIDESRAGS